MAEPPTDGGRVLYVIACAAPPARDVHVLVRLAQAEGWDVCVLATPSGRDFLDASVLERLTRHPVRSEYKRPDEPDVLPPPSANVLAPATFNTINKWAFRWLYCRSSTPSWPLTRWWTRASSNCAAGA